MKYYISDNRDKSKPYRQAGRPDTRVATWKTNFIGVSFDPYYFISKIKEFIEQ